MKNQKSVWVTKDKSLSLTLTLNTSEITLTEAQTCPGCIHPLTQRQLGLAPTPTTQQLDQVGIENGWMDEAQGLYI